MAMNDVYLDLDFAVNGDGTLATEAGAPGGAGAWNTLVSAIAGLAAGDRLNCRGSEANRETLTSSVNLSTSGTGTAPIHIRGYDVVPGDGGFCPFHMYRTARMRFDACEWVFVEGLHVTGDGWSTDIVSLQGDSNVLFRCFVENQSTSSSADRRAVTVSDANIYGCHLVNNGTGSATNEVVSLARGFVCDSLIEARGQSSGVYCSTNGKANTISGNVIIGGGVAQGISLDNLHSAHHMLNVSRNSIRNFENGVKILDMPPTSSSVRPCISANVFANCSAYGIYRDPAGTNGTNTNTLTIIGNAFHACGSGSHNVGDLPTPDEVTLSEDPFIDGGNGVLIPNRRSGVELATRTRSMSFEDTSRLPVHHHRGALEPSRRVAVR